MGKREYRWDYSGTTKERYVEVLKFTHFVTMFEFDSDGYFRGNKRLIQKINCSVVLDLGWGNTQEGLYTIEDRPKGESWLECKGISKKEVSFYYSEWYNIKGYSALQTELPTTP